MPIIFLFPIRICDHFHPSQVRFLISQTSYLRCEWYHILSIIRTASNPIIYFNPLLLRELISSCQAVTSRTVSQLKYQFYSNSFSKMENQSLPPPLSNSIPQRQRFKFAEPREPNIFFSSQFDSGNMHRVTRTDYYNYSIWTACDAQGTNNEGYPKSWFYFQTGGYLNRKVTFAVHRLHFLYAMTKRHHMYRPVYRIRNEEGELGPWERLPHPVQSLSINSQEEMVLKFDFVFVKGVQSVQFAFTYPYSYEQCRSDVLALKEKYQNDKDLLMRQYELTHSYEKRIIDMLVVSSHEGKQGYESFKCTAGEQKLVRFRSSKPIIFISARVHPIETPSSYTINGIIRFLLDKKDMRAHLLRKYFVFVLVPMLNPDGVSRGHCRMDYLNQNLNRYYSTPDQLKQPSCYAVKTLCEYYHAERRLFMYLDLHAHPAYKGNFTFGNAIYEFVEQVESQLFPKVLSQNCINFEFEQCIFSRKHMKARDRNEDVSKEGCGRVVLYRQLGIVHSYTLECGYHLNTFDNVLSTETNTQNKFLVRYRLNDREEKIYDPNERVFEEDKLPKCATDSKDKVKHFDIFEHTTHALDNRQDEYYTRELPTYSPQTFHNLGRNILISILDIWNRNPYTRISDPNGFRKEIADGQAKLNRFRKEQAGIKTKQKRIVQLIEEQFYGEWRKRNVCNNVGTAGNQRDKRRNQTNQAKFSSLKQVKEEKPEQTDKGNKLLEIKTMPNNSHQKQLSEARPLHLHAFAEKEEKQTSIEGYNPSESKPMNARTFKLSRAKLMANSSNGEKQVQRATSTSKELVSANIKLSLEQDLVRASRNEVLCVSSKVIRTPNFNGGVKPRLVATLINHSIPKR